MTCCLLGRGRVLIGAAVFADGASGDETGWGGTYGAEWGGALAVSLTDAGELVSNPGTLTSAGHVSAFSLTHDGVALGDTAELPGNAASQMAFESASIEMDMDCADAESFARSAAAILGQRPATTGNVSVYMETGQTLKAGTIIAAQGLVDTGLPVTAVLSFPGTAQVFATQYGFTLLQDIVAPQVGELSISYTKSVHQTMQAASQSQAAVSLVFESATDTRRWYFPRVLIDLAAVFGLIADGLTTLQVKAAVQAIFPANAGQPVHHIMEVVA